jgi:23S rRNA pseudouridine1911/1915/1917 synthase
MHRLPVPPEAEALSLQRFVAAALDLDPRRAASWIRAGCVRVDGRPGKAGRHLRPGQLVEIDPPPLQPHAAEPQDLPLPIRHLDADLIVVAKPGGMATHPGPGWWRGSCVNALLHAITDWPGIGGVAGPGIVHRLDRDTSGLLVFARSEAAHQALLQAARDHRLEREYLAVVRGLMTDAGSIDAPLGRDEAEPAKVVIRPDGKRALTHYQVLRGWTDTDGQALSLLRLRLETGRNHQIRVHLASLGHPIWGDPVYGQAGPFMALHAERLSFIHPISGERLDFVEPVPVSWSNLLPSA